MDDDQKTPPPAAHEVEALAAASGEATPPPPDDTLPARPAPERSTHQGMPPALDAQAGQTTPPPPDTTYAPGPSAAQEDDQPGLARAIRDSNLDAVAQADPNIPPDRFSAEAVRSMVEGGMIPVPIANIERELIQVWKSTTSGGENEGRVVVTLMRVMNLVIYVDGEERAQHASEVVDRIVGRHPCRTIMMVNRSGEAAPAGAPLPAGAVAAGEHDLDATISAHCELTDEAGKHVCCEQISIVANTADALNWVANVALNLLITDLPVFLWWASDEPFNNVVLSHLEDSIDRLVVDSASFRDPLAGMLGEARTADPAIRQSTAIRYAPSDFNWDRLLGWREGTAQFFDDPANRAGLGRIGTVEIRYAASPEGQEPNPVQGLLYAGWLASRLNWEFHASATPAGRSVPGDFALTLRQGIRSIPVLVRGVPAADQAPGRLVQVNLITNDTNPVTFSVRATSDNVFLDCVVEQDGRPTAERKVRHTDPDEAILLDGEMELFGHDAIFEQALGLAGAMAWASMSQRKRTELSAQLGSEQRSGSFDPRF